MTVIRKIFQIILWLAAGAYGVVGVLAITGALGSARDANSLEEIFIELNRVGFDGAVSIELEYSPQPDQIVSTIAEEDRD